MWKPGQHAKQPLLLLLKLEPTKSEGERKRFVLSNLCVQRPVHSSWTQLPTLAERLSVLSLVAGKMGGHLLYPLATLQSRR